MSEKKPTAGIILAAGMSTRLGRSKQLLPLKGKPLLEWVIEACLDSLLERIVLVLGHDAGQVIKMLEPKLTGTRIQIAFNPRYREGMSRSLKTGLAALGPQTPSVMFLLGDQPMVDAEIIDRLLKEFWASEKNICAPVCEGVRGNPVILSRRFYDLLWQTESDIGARHILQNHPEQVLGIEVDRRLYFFDIDTEDDLRTLQAALDGPARG